MQGTPHISLWLTKAWEFCPSAHYIFIAELLRVGAAIDHGDTDAETIITCRVACTLALLRHCMREEMAKVHDAGSVAKYDVNDDLSALISWLYRLHPGAGNYYVSI